MAKTRNRKVRLFVVFLIAMVIGSGTWFFTRELMIGLLIFIMSFMSILKTWDFLTAVKDVQGRVSLYYYAVAFIGVPVFHVFAIWMITFLYLLGGTLIAATAVLLGIMGVFHVLGTLITYLGEPRRY